MKHLVIALFFILAVLALGVLAGTLVWCLWDDTMVAVFKLPSVTWWQAIKLSWICALLFQSKQASSKS